MDEVFPWMLNGSLGKILIYLEAPEVIETTLTLLERDKSRLAEQANAATDGER